MVNKIIVIKKQKIDSFGPAVNDSMHGIYLFDYVMSDCEQARKTFAGFDELSIDRAQLAAFYIYFTGNIVILNGTSHDGSKYEGSCFVYLPKKVSKEVLDNLKKEISHFNKFYNVSFYYIEREDNYVFDKPLISLYRDIPDNCNGDFTKLKPFITEETIDNKIIPLLNNIDKKEKTR